MIERLYRPRAVRKRLHLLQRPAQIRGDHAAQFLHLDALVAAGVQKMLGKAGGTGNGAALDHHRLRLAA